MKKLFYSLMAAVLLFVAACGAVDGAKDGVAAGKEFAEAYKTANGDPQALVNAFNAVQTKYAVAHAQGGKAELAGYLGGVMSELEESGNSSVAGTFFGIMLGNAQKTGQGANEVQAMVDNIKEKNAKDKAAFQAAVDQAVAWYTAPAAPAQETAEEPAEAEGEEE